MTSKVDRAVRATGQIMEQVHRVHTALEEFEGRIANGWGAFKDPIRQHRALKKAEEAITAAYNEMNKTDWPTNRDYDEEQEADEEYWASKRQDS